MAKISATEKALANLRAERDAIDHAIRKLEAAAGAAGNEPKPARVRKPKPQPSSDAA